MSRLWKYSGIAAILLAALIWAPAVLRAEEVSGTISENTTWILDNSPYIVTDNVFVEGATSDGATLTIQPGVEVRFNSGTYLSIGSSSGNPGTLVAQGTAAAKIVFTANQTNPTAGYWKYLRFNNIPSDGTTVLDYCTIQYAGNGDQGALYLDQASPTIRNTNITDSSSYGILIDLITQNSIGAPTIDTCQFDRNGNYDIFSVGSTLSPPGGTITGCIIHNGIYFHTATNEGITGNTINYNNAFPIQIGANGVGELMSPANTITGLDDQSYLVVNYDTIERDATWPASLKYQVISMITVQGATSAGATLTLEPGTQILFKGSFTNALIIGGTTGSNPGTLIAQGTADAPILFSSANATPAAGNWSYIKFNTTTVDATTILDHCVVEYGGASSGALYLDNASPTIQNTTVRSCQNAGIYLTYGSAPTLTGNIISNCTTYGLYSGASSPIISTTEFSGNGDYDLYFGGSTVAGGTITGCTINNGIYFYTGTNEGITDNVINYNNDFPIRIAANDVGELMSANTVTGLDDQSYLVVNYDTIERDATWPASPKYHVINKITVQGATSAGATLTLEPGTQILFKGSYTKALVIGGTSGNPGALVAQGTADAPVLFSSANTTPAAGDWQYVQFNTTSNNATATSVLDHCVVEYGGSSSSAIYINNASPVIQNTTVRYSKYAGIYGYGTGSTGTVMLCNTFFMNETGISWYTSPPPEMHNNNFSSNTNYDIYYTGSSALNAEDNWWGDAACPIAGGDQVYGNVDADPCAAAEITCTTTEPNEPPNTPDSPSPADGAVRVEAGTGVTLVWTGGDPNLTDVVTYDVYTGTAADALALEAQDLVGNTHTTPALTQGITYYWQVIAKDDQGAQTQGPVWHFTTEGGQPDLIITQLTTTPAGHMVAGDSVTLTAVVQNIGSGPAVDPFAIEFLADSATIGSPAVDAVILAGQSLSVSQTWAFTGGDSSLEILADSGSAVSETNEQNNSLIALLSEVADITPPSLTETAPADGAFLQETSGVAFMLTDTQSAIDATAVLDSFFLRDSDGNAVAGTKGAITAWRIFYLFPETLPLADGAYTASFNAVDVYGNSQGLSFSFTIDTQPPGAPEITGGTVASGTIQARPAQNTADQFTVELTGTRDPGTTVWVNNVALVPLGDDDWSISLTLEPGTNAFEVWLVDAAGNQGPSVWVDIAIATNTGMTYEYDAAGRVRRITHPGE